MQKFQLGLIAMLICCVAFISCERTQKMMAPAEPVEEAMPTDMTDMMDMMSDYMSWTKVELPAPGALADAAAPAETGEAHGAGTRAVYINEAAVGALKDATMTAFPVGSVLVKEIMDDTNTFVWRQAFMQKTDDAQYTEHGGWMYAQYQRESATAEFMLQAGDGTEAGSAGCDGCHAKASTDSVFVKLPAEMMMEMTEGDADDMTEGDTDDMTEGDTEGMADSGADGMMADDMTGDMADDMMADDMTGDMADGDTGDMSDGDMGDDDPAGNAVSTDDGADGTDGDDDSTDTTNGGADTGNGAANGN